jgi:sarcosine oxidase subunit beta
VIRPGDKVRGKVIVCRCEDVTLADMRHAVALGYADIEEVKRYTGFGTGPCQGKECLGLVAGLLCELTGQDPADIQPFTSRPPLAPTPLAHLAGPGPSAESDADRDAEREAETGEVAVVPRGDIFAGVRNSDTRDADLRDADAGAREEDA